MTSQQSIRTSTPSETTSLKPRIFVAFRNDDPSAISDLKHEQKIFAMFEEFGVPQTIAVVPRAALNGHRNPNGVGERSLDDHPEMVQFLKDYARRTGSEIALHGYTHRANRFSSPNMHEFSEFKYLPAREQEQMIGAGVDILKKSFGQAPVTFVPPWNRWDVNTVTACARNGLRVISAGLYLSADQGLIPFGTNTDLNDFPRAFDEAKKAKGVVFLNILFHSNTLTPAQIELLRQALSTVTSDSECEVVTVSEMALRFPQQIREMNEAARSFVPFDQAPQSAQARAWLYISILQKLGLASFLEKLRAQARSLYYRGEYSASAQLAMSLNRLCAAILLGGRGISLLAGVTIGFAIGITLTPRFTSGEIFRVIAIVAALTIAVAALATRKVISRDTRLELLTSGGIAAFGSLIAFFLKDLPR